MTIHRRRMTLVPLVAAAVLSLASCADDDDPVAAAPTASPAVPSDDDPFLGKVVTISGEVVGPVGVDTFRLVDERWGGEPLKVVDVDDATVEEGKAVTVTGSVRIFDRSMLETEFEVVLGEPALLDWAGDQVIVASVIEPVAG